MLHKIIDFHLKQRWVVLVGVILIIVIGTMTMMRIPVDAFPDLDRKSVV